MKDIKLTFDGDLMIKSDGDIALTETSVESTHQSINIVLKTIPGEWPSDEALGFNWRGYMGKPIDDNIVDDVEKQLTKSLSAYVAAPFEIIAYSIDSNSIQSQVYSTNLSSGETSSINLSFNAKNGFVYVDDGQMTEAERRDADKQYEDGLVSNSINTNNIYLERR